MIALESVRNEVSSIARIFKLLSALNLPLRKGIGPPQFAGICRYPGSLLTVALAHISTRQALLYRNKIEGQRSLNNPCFFGRDYAQQRPGRRHVSTPRAGPQKTDDVTNGQREARGDRTRRQTATSASTMSRRAARGKERVGWAD